MGQCFSKSRLINSHQSAEEDNPLKGQGDSAFSLNLGMNAGGDFSSGGHHRQGAMNSSFGGKEGSSTAIAHSAFCHQLQHSGNGSGRFVTIGASGGRMQGGGGGSFDAHHHHHHHSHLPNSQHSMEFQRDSPRISSGVMQREAHRTEKVIALYQYESRSDGDLSFAKGDVMYLVDNSNIDWWYVRNAKGEQGYVPRNFVALTIGPESEEWFAGKIPRGRAERLVSSSNLPSGTFLVREREAENEEYALTIKDVDAGRSNYVKHYKIKRLDNGEGFFITTRKTFKTLRELVSYYSEVADGLCCRLTFPAPRIAPTRPDLSHETQQNWEIPRHQLQLKQKLGDGNFGEVWYGKWRGIVEVAIKTMKPGTMSPEAFLGEAQIMKQCDHPNLVKLYAVCTNEEPFYIITEYMMGGSLLQYLRNEKNTIGLQAMIDMCSQIANGMRYLEERKLVHRDLAARNVLVGEKISGVPVVKVADFGLARKLMEEDIYEARTGAKFPIKWTSPEAATCGNFTTKSDVWSYAVLLYEIFTRGQVPYPGMHNREVIEQVEIGYRMPLPKNCPEHIYTEIMLKCWDKQPERRPTFTFLHSFFDDFFVAAQPNYIPP